MRSANEDRSSIIEELYDMIAEVEELLEQERAAIARIEKELEEHV